MIPPRERVVHLSAYGELSIGGEAGREEREEREREEREREEIEHDNVVVQQ